MPHYLDEISYHRCPRPKRTGQECWCRLEDHRVDKDWPWRVVPPLKEEGDAS
jgi:hypothetical protein